MVWMLLLDDYMPPPALTGVEHIAFCHDVASVRGYVTFVTRFTCKFRCKFTCKLTSVFLLQLITFIPSGLES